MTLTPYKNTARPNSGGKPRPWTEDDAKTVMQLAEQGAWKNEYCAALGISRSTLDNMAERDTECAELLARAQAVAMAWLEKNGRENLNAKSYQQNLFKTLAAARDEDYREKREIFGRGGQPIEIVMMAEDEGL